MLPALLVCLVVGISDGDTLTARCPTGDIAHPYSQLKVRLAEIDAPESGQPYGRRSKEYLSSLCYETEATIRQTATDRYGRTVARVECKGKDANLEMVKAGMAWAYTKYQTDPAFPRAELAARPRVRQLRSQVLVFARTRFQKCHYSGANCSGAAGFPIPKA